MAIAVTAQGAIGIEVSDLGKNCGLIMDYFSLLAIGDPADLTQLFPGENILRNLFTIPPNDDIDPGRGFEILLHVFRGMNPSQNDHRRLGKLLDQAQSSIFLARPVDTYSDYLHPGEELEHGLLLIAHIDDAQLLHQILDRGSDILQSKRREEVIVG